MIIHTDITSVHSYLYRSDLIMDSIFYTLQEFMTHTEGVTYILVVAILLGMLGFWNFLTDRDEDIYKD